MAQVCLEVTFFVCLLAIAGGQNFCLELDEPIESDVTYHLYTNSNPTVSVPIEHASDLESTYFNEALITFVLIHGWSSNYTDGFELVIRPALLANYQVNIIAVDWSPIADQDYNTALCGVHDVGAFVGGFVNSVMSHFALTGSDFQFIGHSLGAHVSGVAGSTLQSPALQIIGADPAGPLVNTFSAVDRLTPDDAVSVKVIHTSTLGYFAPCGTVDYYPNGGLSQPGCGADLDGCSHLRAYYYIAEAIGTNHNFTATLCGSYFAYQLNGCINNRKSLMGEVDPASTVSGTYFLKTNSVPPYARG